MNISGVTYAPRRTHKVRNIMITIVVIIIIAILGVMVLSAYVGWNLLHPNKQELIKFSANVVPEYDDVEFTDINKKINLKGWYFKAKSSDRTVILVHGYGENRLQFKEKTIDMVKKFLDKGYNMLLFDLRNSGISGGDKTTIGFYEKDDVLGAIKFAKAKGSKHVVLLGYSMGASTSIVTAAQSPDVDAVIADSPFGDLDQYLKENMSVWSGLPSFPFDYTVLWATSIIAGIDPKEVSPIKDIEKISPRPVLLIHGTGDINIPARNSEELYQAYKKAAGDNAVLWITQDAAHVKSYEMYTNEYMKRVFEFLDSKVFKSVKK